MFASDLDKATLAQLNRGQRMTELLKQPQFSPVPMEQQVVAIWMGIKGFLDDIALPDINKFERDLLSFLESSHPGVLEKIRDRKKLDDEIEGELKSLVTEFKGRFTSDARAASA